MFRRGVVKAALVVFVLGTALVRGADVTVVKSDKGKSRIEITGIRISGEAGQTFRSILSNDLRISGWFVPCGPGEGALLCEGSAADSAGKLVVSISVRNRPGKVYLRKRYEVSSAGARKLAHKVADEIVEAVKGVKGIASTRIVMIGSRGGGKDLYVCDADGGNFTKVTSDSAVCLSPNWHPDAGRVLYTSYLGGNPHVYLVDLAKKSRKRVSAFPGLNAGASFSPDGRRIALALSKDGNPEIYTMGSDGKGLKRVTVTRGAAEASPVWSPGGRSLAYVSDRSGRPQVYIRSTNGGRDSRASSIGRENVSPDWSASGKLVWASRRGGRYEIVIYDPRTRKETQLTRDGYDYEDPSWAPDGRHIVCSRVSGFHSEVYILDTLGDKPIRLTKISGEWYSPSWSPQ